MIVLGLNAYHGDASATVVVDGEVVGAVEEERFTRAKHQAGFPDHAVRWCLERINARAGDIDHVAVSRDPIAHLDRKLIWSVRHRPSVRSLRTRASNTRRIMRVPDALAAALAVDRRELRARFHRVEHHRAHLGSALFPSPFDDATCLSLDGMGDFVSTMWGTGRANRLDVTGYVPFPASLGVFYTAFTQLLGLPSYGDEYKLMGLAAYGEPRFLPALREILVVDDDLRFHLDLDYFVHADTGVDMTWAAGTPALGALFSQRLAERFGGPGDVRTGVTEKDRDLAASVQARLEEVELELLRRLHDRHPNDRLVLAGGVALNCVVNGKIRSETPFRDVWIQPAAHDAGTSLGAALYVWNNVLGAPRRFTMHHAYLGPVYDASACDAALEAAGLHGKQMDFAELVDDVAGRIAAGAIAGWYQGATEFGPRALGNRSIVCDPRRPDMKDILNARIKHREPFRPFAPSVLAEATGDWFDQAAPSPFMLMTYRVRDERRELIPAVTHADGTARLHTVTRATNERFYDLIAAFGRRTGVPLLLNTSLNENEPITLRPEEACACFVRNDMDVLVMNDVLVDAK